MLEASLGFECIIPSIWSRVIGSVCITILQASKGMYSVLLPFEKQLFEVHTDAGPRAFKTAYQYYLCSRLYEQSVESLTILPRHIR